jgi:REP element-mobilizing transposase RayT
VDRDHNQLGAPFLPANAARENANRGTLRQAPYVLDQPRRQIVLAAVLEVCRYRQWRLLAAHVRSNHVHVVVHAQVPPEKVMNDLKAYASRALNRAAVDSPQVAR